MAPGTFRPGRQRRWAGPFRVCPDCGRRNFAGRAACASCGADLRGAALPQPPDPAILTGRRAEDRIVGRPVWIGLGVAALAALALGLSVKRTFQTGGWALEMPTIAEARPSTEASVAPEPSEPAFPTVEDRAGYQKGRRLLAEGNARAALRPLSDAVRALPNDAAVAHEYGMALMRSGEEDRGLFHLERAARLAPGIPSYRVDFARALAAAGRRGPAARELEGVLLADPHHAAAAEALADLRGQPPAAGGEASSGGVDLGGAASTSQPPQPQAGTVFTNEDLERRRRGAPVPRATLSPSPGPPG